jgi:GT2 family glycosyltransferase
MPEPSSQAPSPPKVSVVVVSHNRKDHLRRALDALEASEARKTFEVVVVDNGSTDGSADLETDYHDARFIRVPRNFGLTKALNLGVRGSTAEYVFFLHDDTEVFPDTVRLLAATLDSDAGTGAVCPLLVDDQDRPAPQLGHFPPDDTWRAADPGTDPMLVDYPRGAALMIRRFFLTAIRQIDERYGQFGSDADLCFLLRRAGRKILLVPTARARHAGRTDDSLLREADRREGTIAFIAKHQGFLSGLRERIAGVLSALVSFRFGLFNYLVSGQKIDGTQQA